MTGPAAPEPAAAAGGVATEVSGGGVAAALGRQVGQIPPSGVRALANAAWAVPGAIHLEFGEPDWPTPPNIVEAAARAARDGLTRNAPSAGVPRLGALTAPAAVDGTGDERLERGDHRAGHPGPGVPAGCGARDEKWGERMTVATNRTRLVTQVLTGQVWPALGDRHAYRTDADGEPFVLPGMGGVTLGVHPGDAATGYAADHLEPGLSIRHRDERANYALQYLACVGNVVTVRTGPAAGARGRVTGQHAYVLADFADRDLEGICVGDEVTLRAYGQGLRLTDHPDIVAKNLDPGMVDALRLSTGPDGRLRVPVAARIPAEAIGAGAGMYSEFANTDLMGAYAGQGADLSLGLEGLRIGDVVAMVDQDHRFGRGYRPGYTTVGVISTGHCRLFGHGPGPSSVLSGPAAAFDIRLDDDANLGTAFPRLGVTA